MHQADGDHAVAAAAADVPTVADAPRLHPDGLFDLKGITRLLDFTGREEDWADWHYRTKAVMPLLGLYDLIVQVEAQQQSPDQAQLSQADQAKSKLLWSLLTQVCKGRAYTILRLCPDGCGVLVWWRLYQQYQTPTQITRH